MFDVVFPQLSLVHAVFHHGMVTVTFSLVRDLRKFPKSLVYWYDQSPHRPVVTQSNQYRRHPPFTYGLVTRGSVHQAVTRPVTAPSPGQALPETSRHLVTSPHLTLPASLLRSAPQHPGPPPQGISPAPLPTLGTSPNECSTG